MFISFTGNDMHYTMQIMTASSDELIDITKKVQDVVRDSGIKSGICLIYTPHTTAAVTIN